jgi:hypothetical protein
MSESFPSAFTELTIYCFILRPVLWLGEQVSGSGCVLICFLIDILCVSTCSISEKMDEKDEQKEFETGPMSVLMQSVKNNTQVCATSL